MGQLTQLNLTPHPVLLDGQRIVHCQLLPGESLYAFLQRHVDRLDGQQWHVSIGGHDVQRHLWHNVRPKDGQVIEVHGALGNNVLQLVAIGVLTYFTFGFGAATAGMWGAGAVTTSFGALAATGVYMAGSMLINSVLGPKIPNIGRQEQDSVYSIGAARNTARPNEPFGIVFGEVRSTPDYISAPYTYYMGNDQYVVMTMTPGLNCQQIGDLYNGDTLLSSFDGVDVWYSGFPGMPEQAIPLYSNVDTSDGGALDDANVWVERTTSLGTMSVMLNYSYVLFDTTTSGKPKNNQEDITAEYRPTGSTTWLSLATTHVVSKEQTEQRKTVEFTFPAVGQYDIRVKRNGNDTDGKGAHIQMSWTTLNSVQPDTTDYTGIPRIGLRIKATGQLNGYPDEIRGVVKSEPIDVWTTAGWVTATERSQGLANPGAQLLAYARGLYMQTSAGTVRYSGLGLTDDMIDMDALKAFMLHCTANGFTYDYIVKDAKSHDEICNTIALAGMGQISWAGGKFSVVWAADEQPISGVVNMATIKKSSFQVDYSLVSAADAIEYSYFDRLTWETKTVIVRAPGVQVALNPAKVSGEGVSDPVHAAKMARYHLGQSLYQFKQVGYSTDLEHMTYRRMSVLQLSHDMTQWGYGGRLVGASDAAGVVTLQLDEPVPPPSAGNAWIGVRIPGETVYRVLAVQAFSAETNQLTLAEPWPSDAGFPGIDFPAHDSIWVYDFKQTPGYRVRVVNIEPESDLKGARISVVPESDEFWTYVMTGEYTPPANGTAPYARPVVSNVRVSEQNNVQGNTIFTTLSVTFDVDGDMQYAAILSQDTAGTTDELVEVAQTQTRTASFRIPGPGTYAIVVRPYDRNGVVGGAASITYTTVDAQPAPMLFDTFQVEEDPSGIRRYSWGYAADTIQSPDLLGAEIRYITGDVPLPNWDSMLQLGDGYHTGPFESVIPVAGQWTFAIRARNTSGILSPDMRVLAKTLQYNLAQKIDETNSQLAQEIIDRFNADAQAADALAAEAQTRANEIAAAADAAAADATAKANAARDAAIAHADVIGAQVADITGADEWVVGASYPDGDLVKYNGTLYRALRASTGAQPDVSPLDWEPIGNYASLGEAVAASIDMGTQNASDIDAESTRLDGVVATIPTLATVASVTDETNARVSADNALGTRVGVVEARMPSGTDLLANEARVVTVENASVSRDDALGSRVTTVEATLPTLATTASVTNLSNSMVSADNALAQDITAANTRIDGKADASALNSLSSTVTQQGNIITSQGTAITQVKSRLGAGGGNLLINSGMESDANDWYEVWNGGGGVIGVRDNAGDAWRPIGRHTFGVSNGGIPPNSQALWFGGAVGVEPGATYIYSAYIASHRCYSQSGISQFTHTMEQRTLFFTELNTSSAGGNNLASWKRVFIKFTTESDVFLVAPLLSASWGGADGSPTGEADPNAWITMPMLERAAADQTEPSAWAPSAAGVDEKYASVTQSISATVNQQGQDIASTSSQVSSLQNTVAGKADSTVVQALDSRVTTAEGTITSHSGSITNLQNSVANKAESSALNSLSSTVTQQGNTITSQGNAITQVKSQLYGGGNLVTNSSVESDLTGWAGGGNIALTLVRSPAGTDWNPPGIVTLGTTTGGSPTTSDYFNITNSSTSCIPGNRYVGSAYVEIHRCLIQLIIEWLDENDAWVGAIGSNIFDVGNGASPGAIKSPLSQWTRLSAWGDAPANARKMRLTIQCTGNGNSNPFWIVAHPQLEEVPNTVTTPGPWQQGAAGIDSKYASVTQSLTTRTTTNENNIASALAQYFLSVQAGNLVGGMKIGNNGSVVDFAILANIFRIVDPNNSANLLSYINGNLTVSGIITGSLLQASALELGSTRIHTGSGRLAPFSISDTAYKLNPNNGVSSVTLTLDGFIGPSNGSGYNFKRFARQRMDVLLRLTIAADDGNEELFIEVQYDGGTWTQIQHIPFDGNNRTTFAVSLRYTTLDSWSTLAFRARTTLVHTNALTLDLEVNNCNESGNAAGSNSGLDSSSGGSGTPPPPPPPEDEFCVDYETTVLPDGRYVRDLQVGDLVECVDVRTGTRTMEPLLSMVVGHEECYRVATAHGEVIQSKSTPMDMRDGSIVRTPELDGKELLTHTNDWEVARILYLGQRKVCKPDFGNRMFFAGTSEDRTIATHNVVNKP